MIVKEGNQIVRFITIKNTFYHQIPNIEWHASNYRLTLTHHNIYQNTIFWYQISGKTFIGVFLVSFGRYCFLHKKTYPAWYNGNNFWNLKKSHIADNSWLIMIVYSPLITCGSIGSSRSCLVTDPAFTRCYSNITLRKFYNWSVGNKIKSFNAKKKHVFTFTIKIKYQGSPHDKPRSSSRRPVNLWSDQ